LNVLNSSILIVFELLAYKAPIFLKFKFKKSSFIVLCSILKVKISLGIPGILLPL